MPNETDWILLRKTLEEYGNLVMKIWGSIDSENAVNIYQNKLRGKNLLEFFLVNEHFADANTLASSISLFNEANIQLIYDNHHQKYTELIQLLSTDKMILLYEEYHQKIHEISDLTITDQNHYSQDFYRKAISKRYQKILLNEIPTSIIINLLDEFKFLTHHYLDDFYQFCTNLNFDHTNRFCNLYQQYLTFIPLIYRIINEYYLEYVKYHIKTILDMYGNSFIIVSEYYDNLKKCLNDLPQDYVDYRYQDKLGNNILNYLANLPYLSETINRNIYQEFTKKIKYIPLDIKNNEGNTLLHIISQSENEIFLDELIKWLFNSVSSDSDKINQIKTKLTEFLMIENSSGKTMFDILSKNNNFTMLFKIIEYLPPKIYLKLTNKLIENFEILDKIPDISNIQQIYLGSINYFIDQLYQMKKEVVYDIYKYQEIQTKIKKLLDRCYNELNYEQDYYLEWLYLCIKSNEINLFQNILSKYFYEKKSLDIQYLNKILPVSGETLIITAIKQQNIIFIKKLFKYQIDLNIVDKLNRNAIIVALETKNLYLLKFIRDYIKKNSSYDGMILVINHFIVLLEKNETFVTLYQMEFLNKLWKTIEYWFNYFFVKKIEN